MDHWSREFPPHSLRDYALLADGERGVVVGPRGEFAWMCFPGWSDPALFATLIGGNGVYAITPVGDRFVWGGYYEDGTLIWRSRWVTTSSRVECREALARPGRTDVAMLLRDVVGIHGTTRVRVVLDPRAEYGAEELRELNCVDGVWTGRTGSLHVRVTGLGEAIVDHGSLVTEVDVPAGARRAFVLEVAERPLAGRPPQAEVAWRATEDAWHADVPSGRLGVWADRDVRHALAVLQGMTSSRGGMVAAVTTSLPERADSGRNYDYRYVWVRDLAMIGQAVAALGPRRLLEQAVGFLVARLHEDGPGLRPAYAVGGGPVPEESTLELSGYPGGIDRIGNRATRQFQLDVFGEALLLLAAAERHGCLDDEGWAAVRLAVSAIEQRAGEPDAGIWEIEPRHWAHSRLIGAAGLRAAAKVAPAAEAGRWATMADALVAEVNNDCLHPSLRWQRAPSDPRVDASLLLPVIRGAVPSGDPRAVATVDGVLDELSEDHFLYRFRQGPGRLSDTEGAFLLCGFHAAIALAQRGDHVEAARWFERTRSACGPSGLFTEEFDVVQRQLRGNLPQAFVHGALIEASAVMAELNGGA